MEHGEREALKAGKTTSWKPPSRGIFRAVQSKFDFSNMSVSVGWSRGVYPVWISSPNSISRISETEVLWLFASEDSHSLISMTANSPFISYGV